VHRRGTHLGRSCGVSVHRHAAAEKVGRPGGSGESEIEQANGYRRWFVQALSDSFAACLSREILGDAPQRVASASSS
jgi:hypothetical protein